MRKNCLSSGWSLLLHQFTRTTIKMTPVIIDAYHCHQLQTKMLSRKIWGFHSDDYEEYRLLGCSTMSAVTCLPVISCYSPALKMEAIHSSETSIQTRVTRCYIPEDDILQNVINILLSTLTPQADKITGDCQCGFPCNRSTIDQTFFFVLGKWWRKMGIQWDSTTAIHRLQEGLWFS
jgi:hypothetical protein